MLDSLSFPPQKRLREKKAFQQVFAQRRRLYSPFYILYYRCHEQPYSRLGIITSKRNIRTAVRRNVARRVAREAFRVRQSEIRGKDIVMIAQKKACWASKSDLHQCLEKLFTKLQKEC